MTKRKDTSDLMSQVLSGKHAATHGSPVVESGEQARINFWMPVAWKKTLTAHFKSQGLDLSSGIRLALSRYMSEEGLK